MSSKAKGSNFTLMFRCLFFCFILAHLGPKLRTDFPPLEFVVWDVGQGQWITVTNSSTCTHFDMGGEIYPRNSISDLCQNRSNRIYFSHWDLDHVGFAKRFSFDLKNSCIIERPKGPAPKGRHSYLKTLNQCEGNLKGNSLNVENLQISKPQKEKDSNSWSRAWLVQSLLLIPGDSPSQEEKRWVRPNKLKKIQWMIAGHHGSHTSSSNRLLKNIPNVKQIIASSRKKRYGHPHPKMLTRSKFWKKAVLSTSDWGTIAIRKSHRK